MFLSFSVFCVKSILVVFEGTLGFHLGIKSSEKKSNCNKNRKSEWKTAKQKKEKKKIKYVREKEVINSSTNMRTLKRIYTFTLIDLKALHSIISYLIFYFF